MGFTVMGFRGGWVVSYMGVLGVVGGQDEGGFRGGRGEVWSQTLPPRPLAPTTLIPPTRPLAPYPWTPTTLRPYPTYKVPK